MHIVPGCRERRDVVGGLVVRSSTETAAPLWLPRVRVTDPRVADSVGPGTRVIGILGGEFTFGYAAHGMVVAGPLELGEIVREVGGRPEPVVMVPLVTDQEWAQQDFTELRWFEACFVWLAEVEVAARPVLWDGVLDAAPV